MSTTYRMIAPKELDGGLTQAWQRLQSEADAFCSPFFSPQFTGLVGEARSDVRLLVIEDGTQPVGFFPYQRAAFGFGRPVGGSLSDYHGVVAHPECEWCVPDLLRAAGLTTWRFDHLVDPRGRFAPYVKTLATSPQIDLRGGFHRYAQARREAGSNVVSQTERHARRLARDHGDLVFRLHDSGADAWESLYRWKGAQYRRTGMTDVFRFRWTRELLARLSQCDDPDFAGMLSSLRAGKRIVAVHMGMRSRHILHWWFPAYDPDQAKYSPGIILLLRLAQAAAEAGLAGVDLGRGDARYKQRVMTASAALVEGSAAQSAWLGTLARAREAMVRIIRRIEPASILAGR
jgi:CelD/BcsL family acetyltransferase involved in cellulose biosynthesis